jgi:hypothetical protein
MADVLYTAHPRFTGRRAAAHRRTSDGASGVEPTTLDRSYSHNPSRPPHDERRQ